MTDSSDSPVAPGVEAPASADDHLAYMRLALAQAERSPPKPTNYCVGAVLVDERANTVLATGFTLELPGNTHAEQCCLSKYFSSPQARPKGDGNAEDTAPADEAPSAQLPDGTVLYTTMEPCSERLSGNMPCVDRILALAEGERKGITKVYVGVQEPEKFVGSNVGRRKLEEAGIEYVHVKGLEDKILAVATAGHDKSGG